MNTELQQRIIKQATRMFFCNGIKSVTMDMIASQLGISKRTLYENFKEKNEFVDLCNAFVQRMCKLFESGTGTFPFGNAGCFRSADDTYGSGQSRRAWGGLCH